VFDQYTAYQYTTNLLLPYEPDITYKKEGKGLKDACRAYPAGDLKRWLEART
jgi:hypothetical protein